MMKKILLALCLMLVSAASWAAKAYPGPITVTQSDGTQLTVFAHGDEDFHWYTTADGILLVQKGTNFYVAAIDDDGNLTATEQLAHNQADRTVAEQQLIAAQAPRRAAFFREVPARKQRAMQRRIPIGNFSPAYFPHTGEPTALVILVQFSDTTFSCQDPVATFNDYLNKEGGNIEDRGLREDRNYGSVRQYFTDMSGGLFKPRFDVVGPVTLPKASGYYGKNSGNTKDVNYSELIKDACKAIDETVNFANYDSNGDKLVDLVYIIYAGYSESMGASAESIWPKSGYGSFGTYDGVTVKRFGLNNELNYHPTYKFSAAPFKRINGIGLFCHEFSHTMGLPDLYPNTGASGQTVNNQSMEFWDLMDAGEYSDNGYTPTPYTPWELEVMGWAEIKELTGPAQITLPTNEYYRISSETNNEYLILQNLQRKDWASRMPAPGLVNCHGLLVYRIDYSDSNGNPITSVNLGDYPNNVAGKPGITLAPADGLLINYELKGDGKAYSSDDYLYSHEGDPYPGKNNVTQLLSVKMNRCTIEKPIYNIKETDGVITFDYLENYTSAIDNVLDNDEHGKNSFIFDLQGRKIAEKALNKGIYIKNGKKFVVK